MSRSMAERAAVLSPIASLRRLASWCSAVAVCATLATAGVGSAAPTEKDKKLLAEVSTSLLAVCKQPEGFEWPPNFDFDKEAEITCAEVSPPVELTEGLLVVATPVTRGHSGSSYPDLALLAVR